MTKDIFVKASFLKQCLEFSNQCNNLEKKGDFQALQDMCEYDSEFKLALIDLIKQYQKMWSEKFEKL